MDPLEITFELRRSDISQADVGRRCDPPVTRQMVNQVIWGKLKSARIRECIAAVMGRTVDEIFPPNGNKPGTD